MTVWGVRMRRMSRPIRSHSQAAPVEYGLIVTAMALATLVILLGISGKLVTALTHFGVMLGWTN